MSIERNQKLREGESGSVLIGAALALVVLACVVSGLIWSDPFGGCEDKRDQVSQEVITLKSRLDIFYARKGQCPDSRVGRQALIEAKVMKKIRPEPRGHPYVYRLEDGNPKIIIYAQDGVPGGPAGGTDISSEELHPRT